MVVGGSTTSTDTSSSIDFNSNVEQVENPMGAEGAIVEIELGNWKGKDRIMFGCNLNATSSSSIEIIDKLFCCFKSFHGGANATGGGGGGKRNPNRGRRLSAVVIMKSWRRARNRFLGEQERKEPESWVAQL